MERIVELLLDAIENPEQQATLSQLQAITAWIQQVTSRQGFDLSRTRSILSALGNALRSTLVKQQRMMGNRQLENLLRRFCDLVHTSDLPSLVLLQSLFPPRFQKQIMWDVSRKTGISPNVLQIMLPDIIPAILTLLNMGAVSTTSSDAVEVNNAKASIAKAGIVKDNTLTANPLLNAFLDNHDAGMDLAALFEFSIRFCNPAYA